MKALVFGRTGQVARELARHADASGVTLLQLDRDQADLSQPETCATAIADHQTDIIINAAAYTAVDMAESEPELAHLINAEAPGVMARAAAELGRPFLHVSTDYVFDGAQDVPWREGDTTGPQSVYGASKLAGEKAVRAAGGPHAILRTAWVFSAHGTNFVKTMLRLAKDRDELGIVSDQTGGPTPAADIAAALLTIGHAFNKDDGVSGVFHFCGLPAVTWAEFATEIFERAGLTDRVSVNLILTTDYPTPAKRPQNSVLDCTAITEIFGIEQPDWRVGLGNVLKDIT